MKTAIFILGPTCTGKTDLGFFLAKKLHSPVINADSLQCYKGMDIGTAKPDWKKRHPLLPCYLFDHIKPPQIYTAGQFQKDAQSILNQHIHQKNCLVVGGSGFYLQALEKGCYPIPPMDRKTKKYFKEKEQLHGLSSLYEELEKLDIDYAQSIHRNDQYRIFRALQVIQYTGLKMSEVKKSFKAQDLNYHILKIGLTAQNQILKQRVIQRTHEMLYKGLVHEVQQFIDQGLENFPPLQSVGYKETLRHLRGELSLESLHGHIVQRTMQLIKKQKKWFRRDPSIHWYDYKTDYKKIYKFYNLHST